jgi:acyl-CoA synthetase (AMP-forming)/AMP-acid ligase II
MVMTQALWDHIRVQAGVRPDALAIYGPAGPTAFATLAREVDALATALLEQGLSPSDMVGLHLGFTPLHLCLILALDRLSIPSMSFAADPTAMPVVLPQFGLTIVISGLAAPADAGCRWIRMVEPVRVGGIDADRLARIDAAPDAVVRVCWSSGTTGGAKGIPITRALQAERLTVRRLLRGVGPRTRYFPGLPFSVAISYVTALATLAAGGAVVLPSAASHFIDLANALQVTLTLGSPSLLADLVGDGAKPPPERLATVEMFDVLGAQLPVALARRARSVLTPNLTLAYGVTEIGRVAVADAAIVLVDPAATGFVIPWVDLEIVDPADRPVAPGREGLVRIRSAQMVAGYLNDPAATAQNFRDGWFYPGDVGVLTADRLLRLTGRIEDMIDRDGALVSLQPTEDALRAVTGVRDAAVFSLPGAAGTATLCAALVLAPDATPAAVRAAAAARLGDRLPPRLFVVEQLPRNAAGKVMRRELAEMARRERLP